MIRARCDVGVSSYAVRAISYTSLRHLLHLDGGVPSCIAMVSLVFGVLDFVGLDDRMMEEAVKKRRKRMEFLFL